MDARRRVTVRKMTKAVSDWEERPEHSHESYYVARFDFRWPSIRQLGDGRELVATLSRQHATIARQRGNDVMHALSRASAMWKLSANDEVEVCETYHAINSLSRYGPGQ